MCSGSLMRLAVPECDILRRHRYGYGYNNGGFILDQRDERLKHLVEIYCVNLGYEYPEKIACGKCLECRLAYTKQWAQRLVCEASLYEDNWFVTLTYNDDNLINCIEYTVNPWTDALDYVPILHPKDFTAWKKKFLELIRYKTGHTGIRFYNCGEYGSKNHRPHFHAILFNCPLPDVKLVKTVNLGGFEYCYYHSDVIEQSWGKGFIMLGKVNWNTCAYVARYVMKKLHSEDKKTYEQLCELEGVPPVPQEYVNMSRRPGIARDYYEHNWQEIYSIDKVVLENGKTVRPAKYYDKLFDIEYPEDMERIKAERKRIDSLKELQRNKGLTFSEKAEFDRKRHEKLERSVEKLKRNL